MTERVLRCVAAGVFGILALAWIYGVLNTDRTDDSAPPGFWDSLSADLLIAGVLVAAGFMIGRPVGTGARSSACGSCLSCRVRARRLSGGTDLVLPRLPGSHLWHSVGCGRGRSAVAARVRYPRRARISACSGKRPSCCFEKMSSPSASTSYWLLAPSSISASCSVSSFSSAARLAARVS
jgi:hypothetical protein